jgi:probable rRNA maturation factor
VIRYQDLLEHGASFYPQCLELTSREIDARESRPVRGDRTPGAARLTAMRPASMLPRVAVLVRYRGTRGPRVAAAVVRTRAERLLSALALHDAELSILLCDSAIMRSLNRRHRGGDYATDVLAFPLFTDPGEAWGGTTRPMLLGDIVLCIPTAARQARAGGKPVLAEVTMLLAHGLLHLLGLDHRNAGEERRMLARTDVLVSAALGKRRARGGQNPPRLGPGRRSARGTASSNSKKHK